MPDVLDEARRTIEKRINELEEELKSLRRALGKLGDGRRPSRRRSRRSSRQSRSPARASTDGGRRLGKRQEQFLGVVKKNPGSQVAELSRSIGISPQQGYGIAESLRKRGRIKKQGKGYAIKA
jgi:hypothetical protein